MVVSSGVCCRPDPGASTCPQTHRFHSCTRASQPRHQHVAGSWLLCNPRQRDQSSRRLTGLHLLTKLNSHQSVSASASAVTQSACWALTCGPPSSYPHTGPRQARHRRYSCKPRKLSAARSCHTSINPRSQAPHHALLGEGGKIPVGGNAPANGKPLHMWWIRSFSQPQR